MKQRFFENQIEDAKYLFVAPPHHSVGWCCRLLIFWITAVKCGVSTEMAPPQPPPALQTAPFPTPPAKPTPQTPPPPPSRPQPRRQKPPGNHETEHPVGTRRRLVKWECNRSFSTISWAFTWGSWCHACFAFFFFSCPTTTNTNPFPLPFSLRGKRKWIRLNHYRRAKKQAMGDICFFFFQ